jgi:hypothetical protein
LDTRRSLNNVYAGLDNNLYRRNEGNWEQHSAQGWQYFRPESLGLDRRPEFENLNRQLDSSFAARQAGEFNASRFPSINNFGGFHGGFDGYHAPTGFRGGGMSFGGFHGGRR